MRNLSFQLSASMQLLCSTTAYQLIHAMAQTSHPAPALGSLPADRGLAGQA